MSTLDKLQTLYPTYVTDRTCTAYELAPQARCYVTFKYIGLPSNTQIYEEFTFNNTGEITFIEAWSDTPELAEMIQNNALPRLSQNQNDDDLTNRIKFPVYYWFKELLKWF